MNKPRPPIKCNGCTKCCQEDMIRLTDQEIVEDHYLTREVTLTGPAGVIKYVALDIKPGSESRSRAHLGECVYLGPRGCSIHLRRPHACRLADCRDYFAAYDKPTRRKMAKKWPHAKVVFDEGKRRS